MIDGLIFKIILSFFTLGVTSRKDLRKDRREGLRKVLDRSALRGGLISGVLKVAKHTANGDNGRLVIKR